MHNCYRALLIAALMVVPGGLSLGQGLGAGTGVEDVVARRIKPANASPVILLTGGTNLLTGGTNLLKE